MIAEISAVVGILKALNDGIATVKESGDHLSGLSGLFTSLTDSKVAVESIEEATKAGDHILTQEEALELAWAKNAIREQEKELKKITPKHVWRDMLMIQNKSLLDHKHKLEKIRLAKLKKQRQINDAVKNVLATIVVLAVFAGTYWLFNTGTL
jgi:serine/threonine protein phosphatase PrpC